MKLNPDQATRRLILLPAVVTLVVTLLRLVGELRPDGVSLFTESLGRGSIFYPKPESDAAVEDQMIAAAEVLASVAARGR